MHITCWHYLDSDSGGGCRVENIYSFTGSNILCLPKRFQILVARHVTMFVSFKTTMVYEVKTKMAAAN